MDEVIATIQQGQALPANKAASVMRLMISGQASPDDIKAFLLAMNDKGPTVDELVGFARCMREHAIRVECTRAPLVDTCGTGGDASHTFNVSTCAAFIAAGAGVNIAKHGNRAMSSACGSADVLEELGVNINLPPEEIGRCIDKIGIGFMFAQAMHPAMKHVAPVRRELKVHTVFNLLGPLTNPAGATRQVMGVFDPQVMHLVAAALGQLGCEHALVVHGEGGLDEFSLLDETRVVEMKNGELTSWSVSPEDIGLHLCTGGELRGGTKEENAQIIRDILSGEPGPKTDCALLNAAAAIAVAGICDFGTEAVERARAAIASGEAKATLERLVEFTTPERE